jgi:hypothetical protein
MVAALAMPGCGGDDTSGANGPGGPDNPDVPAGSTALVAVINPVVNTGHNTGAPDQLGDEREGIVVEATPGGSDISVDGIAVVGTGIGDINVGVGAAVRTARRCGCAG